jgi:hypothetical protein
MGHEDKLHGGFNNDYVGGFTKVNIDDFTLKGNR